MKMLNPQRVRDLLKDFRVLIAAGSDLPVEEHCQRLVYQELVTKLGWLPPEHYPDSRVREAVDSRSLRILVIHWETHIPIGHVRLVFPIHRFSFSDQTQSPEFAFQAYCRHSLATDIYPALQSKWEDVCEITNLLMVHYPRPRDAFFFGTQDLVSSVEFYNHLKRARADLRALLTLAPLILLREYEVTTALVVTEMALLRLLRINRSLGLEVLAQDACADGTVISKLCVPAFWNLCDPNVTTSAALVQERWERHDKDFCGNLPPFPRALDHRS